MKSIRSKGIFLLCLVLIPLGLFILLRPIAEQPPPADESVTTPAPAPAPAPGDAASAQSTSSTPIASSLPMERAYKGIPIPERFADFEALDRLPRLIYKVPVPYPDSLDPDVAGKGFAEIVLFIDSEGFVESVSIAEISNPAFADSVLQSARLWRFEPVLLDSRPSAFWLRTEVEIRPGF